MQEETGMKLEFINKNEIQPRKNRAYMKSKYTILTEEFLNSGYDAARIPIDNHIRAYNVAAAFRASIRKTGNPVRVMERNNSVYLIRK